ncbi:hypothetical protein CRYUN_Cryun01aG0064200 [Craigia yunnanensis]
MGFSGNQNPEVGSLLSMDSSRKRKRRNGLSVSDTLKLWSENSESKQVSKTPAKGSKKGCMKGKGGPQNQNCNYRGVRQRTWGKWVAEIRAPNGGKKLWLGTFPTGFEAAVAYDEAARAMYGEKAILNKPHVSDSYSVATSSVSNVFLVATTTTGAVSDSMTCVSSNSEICDNNVGGEGETNGMDVQFPVDSEAQWNSTVNEIQDVNDMKAEAEKKKEAKPEDESMKETDYSFLDGLELFDDISMDFGGNSFWDGASFNDECEFFNVDEFLS